MTDKKPSPEPKQTPDANPAPANDAQDSKKPQEHGGPSGLEPTRYGDWERNGKCVDF